MSFFGSKKKRKGFTPGQKLEILANQNHRCADCNKPFAKNRRPHFDHIDGDSSNNDIDNGQALCPNCHDLKTRDQSRARIKSKKQHDPLDFWGPSNTPKKNNKKRSGSTDFWPFE